jgi:hypothetical protein
MEIWYRQQFFFSCLYPLFTVFALAFRAMAVTTAIVADAK